MHFLLHNLVRTQNFVSNIKTNSNLNECLKIDLKSKKKRNISNLDYSELIGSEELKI